MLAFDLKQSPQDGVAFVSTSSVGEYPMHWREVSIYPCKLRLTTHPLGDSALLEKSRRRESRRGRNQIKVGSAFANDVIVHTCPAPWDEPPTLRVGNQLRTQSMSQSMSQSMHQTNKYDAWYNFARRGG